MALTFGVLFVVAPEPVFDAKVLQILLDLFLILEIYTATCHPDLGLNDPENFGESEYLKESNLDF